MASLVLGAVGAAIGSTIPGTLLGMSFTSIGWSIGSTLGSMLYKPKGQDITQEGSRLGDLKVQSSTYGNPLPIIYGSMRVAGNIIWSTDIVETRHTSTQSSGGGGKGGGGGGGSKVTTVSYTYSQSFAIAISEGPITGVRKIWANGKLIYNLSDTASVASVIASNASASGIRVYTGSESQTADSLIQANVGAANAPAYRGTAYVVFENLQLADYGNRMPNVEFEVIVAGSALGPNNGTAYSPSLPAAVGYASSGVIHIHAGNSTTDGGVTWKTSHYLYSPDGVYIGDNSYFSSLHLNISGDDPDFGFYPSGTTPVTVTFYRRGEAIGSYVCAFNPSGYAIRGNAQAGVMLIFRYDLTTLLLYVLDGEVVGSIVLPTNTIGYGTVDRSSGYYYHYDQSGTLRAYSAAFAVVNSWPAPTVPLGGVGRATVMEGVIMLSGPNWMWGSTTAIVASQLNADGTVTYIGTWADSLNQPHIQYGKYVSITRLYPVFFDPKMISESSTTLNTIVSDICERAGLAAGEIDVTALTDEVHGYVVQRSTGRAQIEQLMRAFYFDAVESGGKVKFVKRGASPAITIAEDDLAAHEYGSAPPDTALVTRTQEMELPLEMDIQYLDTAAAYQVGAQYSQRLTTESENKVSQNFAIAMSASKAKQIADVLMYDAWTARTQFDFQTGWKYGYLEPTDVIDIVKAGRTYTVRLADEDYSLVSRRRAALEDPSIYTQAGAAAEILAPDEEVALTPLTKLALMDIPLLRDQDDGVGFYAAACGYGAGWYGAQAYKSADAGATWGSFGAGFLNDATIGTASTALGAFTQNIFDETNSVTVVLLNGELASDTEANVLNGANAALLGAEIIQFKTATLVSDDTYTLTGLLRGRRGTEWAASTHAAGERFVLLDAASTYILEASSAEYDLERHYRAATFGGFLDDAETVAFTNTAVAQTPLAPVLLGGGRNAADDITLNWTRRTRIGGGWNNYADVPLGEASESYEVEIWDGSGYATLKRTIAAGTPTASYTAAEQTTDFGSAQSTVYCRVYQLSAAVGRGYKLEGTV